MNVLNVDADSLSENIKHLFVATKTFSHHTMKTKNNKTNKKNSIPTNSSVTASDYVC